MTTNQLEKAIERHFAAGPAALGDPDAMTAFLALRRAIENGEVRAAEPDAASPTGWRVNAWVKRGILLGFRLGALEEMTAAGLSFVDKHTYPARHFTAADGVRWSRAALRFAPAPTWRAAWFACRPCTSMQARMSTRAQWWTRTRWSAPARRSASACI